MNWVIFLLLTIITWGSYNLFFKGLESHINYFLALLIIGASQVIVALPFVIYYHSIHNLHYSTKGLLLAVTMGVLLGLGTIFFFHTFKSGAVSSIAIPAYTIGALIVGTVGSILLFNEGVSPKIIIGIALGVVSILLLTSK